VKVAESREIGGTAETPETRRVAELVRGAQRGGQREFRDLMTAYQSSFYGLARRYAGSHEEADDVLQEAFVKVYQNLAGLSRPEAFFPWARRILINTALDHIRRRRRGQEFEVEVENLDDTPSDEGFEAPDRHVERREFFRRLERVLRSLPPRQREIVTLHDVDGLATDEIARLLDCPPATVRSNLFYAREKLRRLLSGGESGRKD
jgi:RNA polymerase sigma-70 factor (ECF subfamily)